MYANVRLLNGWTEHLTYKIPDQWDHQNLIGALVSVPLQKRFEYAVIESLVDHVENTHYVIKEIIEYDALANNALYKKFIHTISGYYALDQIALYRRLIGFLKEKETKETVLCAPSDELTHNVTLTNEQQCAVDGITPFITASSYQPFVIHGVTGSGKTEVYQKLITLNHAQGKTTILLLPEVSLAVQFTTLLKNRLNNTVPVFGFHSATSVKEKRSLWNHLRNAQPALIIGVHLPILLPMANLGLIIIDEEHEVGYQEKKHPKLNTKEIALVRAQTHGIPILLGSATPSISTLYNVHQREWKLFEITKRFAGAFPRITTIKLDPKQKRSHFWISKELEAAIQDRLERKEQILIFLNRRGFSFFVQCLGCGFIFRCTNCSVALTFHEGDRLQCHYCGHTQPLVTKCTQCTSTNLLKKGIGTQQVVAILQRLFPQARIARADLDTTIDRKKWQKTVDDFTSLELDILVGTQTITKGYHFPNVTLVGILWADMHLGLPAYNAAEVTLQQLIQVAGRAGRQHEQSLVIVQTMLEHAILRYIDETSYKSFYDYEIGYRTNMSYPPVARFAEIELRCDNEDTIEHEAHFCAELLDGLIQKNNYSIQVLGPAQPPVHKIKHIHMRKIYLKGPDIKGMIMLYVHLKNIPLSCALYFTPNPLSL